MSNCSPDQSKIPQIMFGHEKKYPERPGTQTQLRFPQQPTYFQWKKENECQSVFCKRGQKKGFYFRLARPSSSLKGQSFPETVVLGQMHCDTEVLFVRRLNNFLNILL